MIPTEHLFSSFHNLNVLIVGDVMIDRYLTGNVERISPEAPVPVVHLERRDNRLGGAANVALNIRSLGATPYLCSVIGQDEDGAAFLKLLPEAGLTTKGIVTSKERITTVKTRVIAHHQHLLRVDSEVTHDLSARETGEFLDTVRDILENRNIHVILFQDYNKGVLTPKVIREIVLEAVKRDIPTAVDPKYHNFWAYKHVTLFKPNLKEVTAQVRMPVEAEVESLQKVSEQIRSKLGNVYTLITLSEKGLYIDGNGAHHLIPTIPRAIADVCGAGDTVISVAALGLALSLDLREIALLSNLAGGQVCERVGVVPVDRFQLEKEYEQYRQREKV